MKKVDETSLRFDVNMFTSKPLRGGESKVVLDEYRKAG
jgi:hypothetical protein